MTLSTEYVLFGLWEKHLLLVPTSVLCLELKGDHEQEILPSVWLFGAYSATLEGKIHFFSKFACMSLSCLWDFFICNVVWKMLGSYVKKKT